MKAKNVKKKLNDRIVQHEQYIKTLRDDDAKAFKCPGSQNKHKN